MSDEEKKVPSLLEKESTGGDIAEGGFDFQTNLILCNIPYWLASEGFTSFMREGIADIEARFFQPHQALKIEAIEAKNYRITPARFWEEMERFKKIDDAHSSDYAWFTLSCTVVNNDLQPLVNGLRRVRDPQSFFDPTSSVIEQSYEEYKKIVAKLGKDESWADFVYRKVLIDPNWADLAQKPGASFRDSLERHLPEYAELPGKEIDNIYRAILELVRQNKAKPVFRADIEKTIRSAITKNHPEHKPIYIYTESQHDAPGKKDLVFQWAEFSGGEDRQFPEPANWNERMVSQLNATRAWILENRDTHRINLKGYRRLSSSFAFGHVFSATKGFQIEMEYRDQLWSTDDYANATTPDYPYECDYNEKQGEELVVTIGIMKPHLRSEVEDFLHKIGEGDLPMVHIVSPDAILSPQQLDRAVNKLKVDIVDVVRRARSKKIKLFMAGPATLALFLGHRWNTLPPVQCYERVDTSEYVPSCSIESKD